jgi:sugar phosphate isomerase/epimerase
MGMKSQPVGAGLSKRRFMAGSAAVAMLLPGHFSSISFGQSRARPDSKINGVQIGVISYSFRSMPDQSAAAILRYCLEAGISAVELMGEPAEAYAGLKAMPANPSRLFPLMARSRPGGAPLNDAEAAELAELQRQQAAYRQAAAAWRATAAMDGFERLRRLYNDAGVTIYGFKPATFESDSTAAEIDYGMRAARAVGASHVTVELPTDAAHTLRLGEAASRHGLVIGYHQHLQARPDLWDTALAQSRGNGINLDLGHFVAAGDYDGLDFMRRHHARITSIHMKDRKSKANGQANLPWGSGDTPLRQALQLMRDQKYAFPATIELEYEIPAGSNAVAEVAKCLAFCRAALAAT